METNQLESQQVQTNGTPSENGSKSQKNWYSGLLGRTSGETPVSTEKAFKGSWHFNGEMSYRGPPQWGKDVEKGIKRNEKHEYKNVYHKTSKTKAPGVETYLSPTRCEPRPLIVQASHDCCLSTAAEWNRRRIGGSVPTALRISEWTLKPAFDKSRNRQRRVRWLGLPLSFLRTILVALPLQAYMAFPIFTPPWEEASAEDTYMDWPGVLWKWPKFAVNPLDMSPESPDSHVNKLSDRPRLIRPRLLMVLEGDEDVKKDLRKDPSAWKPYVMVSFANKEFHARPDATGHYSEEGRKQLKRIARMHAKKEGVEAYWVDWECSEQHQTGELMDSDINRFCDVIRGATRVIIALPDDRPESGLEWGKRMWTLPEGLLATGTTVDVHYADTDTCKTFSKLDLAATMWSETNKHRDGEDVQATRTLAEHYTGTLQLSRLELMSTAIVALWDRKDARHFNPAELAHALMGLLHTRIDPVRNNTLFQDIAKLSLLNDTDHLIERMVCLLSVNDTSTYDDKEDVNNDDPFRMLSKADQFNTYLWDIQPSCQVVGVDTEDRTVILNECRAIAIRWKKFPRMLYKRPASLKKLVAEIFLRSGAWWYLTAIGLSWTYAPIWISDVDVLENDAYDSLSTEVWLGLAIAFFFGIGTLLSLLGPLSMRILYGGMVLQPAPHLVGFEGTLPIDKLEKIIFGNYDGRLDYAPSSTPLCKEDGFRDVTERVGVEPLWVSHPGEHKAPVLEDGYRLFTLVDTGNLGVSIFAAKRPPTVALICGREGGMLRTVLCSWDFIKDCLYKETVIRLPTETYEMAVPKGWLRLHLGGKETAQKA